MKITKAYHGSIFAVALWGLTALLLTGEFSEALLAVCYSLTGLAFLLHRRGVRTPDLFWNGLTLIAFGVTLYLARKSLLDAAIYFFMYLLVAKLFTMRRATDARWIYLVVFFQMVGAAVLTTSFAFAFVFAVYVALMACSLMLFTIYREQERVGPTASLGTVEPGANGSEADDTRERSALRGIARVSSLSAFGILAASVLFFALIPRLSTQKLFQGYGQAPEKPAQSAFDEQIEFGSFGNINLDTAVAMYVRPTDLDHFDRPNYLRLRGVALDTFDGRAWKRTTTPLPMTLRPAFAPFNRGYNKEIRSYTIIQPPGVTNYLFADNFPDTIRVPQEVPYVFDPLSNSAWLPNMLPKDLQYSVTSRVERLETRVDPEEAENRPQPKTADAERFAMRSGLNLSRTNRAVVTDRYLDRCLEVPKSLNAERIRTMTTEWIGSAATPFRKARSIEERFRTSFGYTLEQKARGNFIEDFLFNVREGHCEYFATSMAIMLRTVGVPARVVNGYYSTEWNSIGNAFTVRQRDAHSWVEAYLGDDYGWMTFDPTPPSGVGRPVMQNAAVLMASRLIDAVKVRWYRYVIDYTFRDQIGVIRSALQAHEFLSGFMQAVSFQFFGTGSQILSNTFGFGILLGGLVLVPVAILGALWVLWRLLRGVGLRKRRRTAETAIRFYRDILRQLARQGYVRGPGQTPREFAGAVSAANPALFSFVNVTELYYASRFSDRKPTGEELAEASRLLHDLKHQKVPKAG